MSIITSPSGFTYRSEQENGDNVDCWTCGTSMSDDEFILTNRDGYAFCCEGCILEDHDAGEELHSYYANGDEFPTCEECGDTEEGLMHNNTDRNIEPLLWEY